MTRTLVLALVPALNLLTGCRAIQSCSQKAGDDSAHDSTHDSTPDSWGDTSDTYDTAAWPAAGEPYTETFDINMLAYLGPATFTMGSDAADVQSNERPEHLVTLTHAFWLQESEVTQRQYETAMGANPSFYGDCPECPVDQVTWYDAAHFANVMSNIGGFPSCYHDPAGDGTYTLKDPDPYACAGYRLPTEAEWEYAASGAEDDTYSGSNTADDVAWTSSNSGGEVHEVCTLQRNALGFCDFSGNVWELVGDGYGPYTEGDQADPHGVDGADFVINRGGSWHDESADARVTNRSWDVASFTAANLGFRIARSVP